MGINVEKYILKGLIVSLTKRSTPVIARLSADQSKM